MYKPILSAIIIASLFSFSCGSKKIARKEMLNDVNEMCKCFRAGKESSVKYMECSDKNVKMRDKYRPDNAQLTQYDAELKTCMEGN